MISVTRKFKTGGLHENHVVANFRTHDNVTLYVHCLVFLEVIPVSTCSVLNVMAVFEHENHVIGRV